MKEKRFKTVDTEYKGEIRIGRTHRYLYSYENKLWYVSCRGIGKDPYGKVVDETYPITCKRCLKH